MHLGPAHYAIVKFKGIRKLARSINVDQAFVHRWRKKGLIPAQHQVKVLQASQFHNVGLTPTHILYGGNVHSKIIERDFPWMLKDLEKKSE